MTDKDNIACGEKDCFPKKYIVIRYVLWEAKK